MVVKLFRVQGVPFMVSPSTENVMGCPVLCDEADGLRDMKRVTLFIA
jgi:hypothetical protein